MIIRKDIPRLPLDGKLDLTYRCNNNCRHCWLWLPQDSPKKHEELSFEEIRRIVDQARALGCQAWSISGGEPMLRPDFFEVFDYITRKSIYYSLNTNGTLITPEIANLLKRKGRKMVAIYGATAEVHDFVTRTPNSFEATMRGVSYLQETGAFFTIQIIPMQANFHQYEEMLRLAQSLSNDYRVGASWLHLSAYHSKSRNSEIENQRLSPEETITLDPPNPVGELLVNINRKTTNIGNRTCASSLIDDRLFNSCISVRRDFHIDPYGQMSFCPFIKDESLRYNLRKGDVQQAWNTFIPSLSEAVFGGQEYRENCGSCDLRSDCNWCPVYAFLEHGRYTAKVDYLCQIAEETKKYKEEWLMTHKRFYQIAGITFMLYSEIPFTENTFIPVYKKFEVSEPGTDVISIQLVPSIPLLTDLNLGHEIYRRPPWIIYRQRDSWVYQATHENGSNDTSSIIALFNENYTKATIFSRIFSENAENLPSLTTFTTDQIILAKILADRQACYLHASCISINGKGFLFVGHSDAGKSTIMKMLREKGEIFGDDRIIVRKWPNGIRVHGTWSHGELRDVSPGEVPLHAILFLQQSKTNTLTPVTNKREQMGMVLSHVIKALITEDWWEKILDLVGIITSEIPMYRLKFDKSGEVVDILENLFEKP